MIRELAETKSFNVTTVEGDDTFRIYTLGEAGGSGSFAYLGVEISCYDFMISTRIYLSDDLDDLYAKVPDYFRKAEEDSSLEPEAYLKGLEPET